MIQQRLHVSRDGGKRGAKFMRDIGDEVSLRAFDLLNAGDVVEYSNRTATGHGRDVDFEDVAGDQRSRAAFADNALIESGADALENSGVADGLYQSVSKANGAARGGTVMRLWMQCFIDSPRRPI